MTDLVPPVQQAVGHLLGDPFVTGEGQVVVAVDLDVAAVGADRPESSSRPDHSPATPVAMEPLDPGPDTSRGGLG